MKVQRISNEGKSLSFGAKHIADVSITKIVKDGSSHSAKVSLVEFMQNNPQDMEVLNLASNAMTPRRFYNSDNLGKNSHVYGLVEHYQPLTYINSSGINVLGLVETSTSGLDGKDFTIHNFRVMDKVKPKDNFWIFKRKYVGVENGMIEALKTIADQISVIPYRFRAVFKKCGFIEQSELKNCLKWVKK